MMSVGLHPERELPDIPAPGFYWAKLVHSEEEWTVVQITEHTAFGRTTRNVDCLGWDAGCWVAEWGPKLEPPQ